MSVEPQTGLHAEKWMGYIAMDAVSSLTLVGNRSVTLRNGQCQSDRKTHFRSYWGIGVAIARNLTLRQSLLTTSSVRRHA
jgi:hypothetical protein